jgi:UDP-N-acetylmuramate--alanine ligase
MEVTGVVALKTIDFSGRPFHFIGVGGIGMSAIAHILVKQGFVVSGSDTSRNGTTSQLEKLGVKIFHGHNPSNISLTNAPQVVCSTAINSENTELQVAIARDLPIWHRSDLLAALIGQFQSVAVAGTHGKTTTSSLIAHLFLQAGLDPTIVIGGEVSTWQGNARLGESKYLVAEADESDGSFVKFAPKIGVVTNIELDHPDFYHSLDQVVKAFVEFSKRCDLVVACLDDPNVREFLQPDLVYSIANSAADYYVTDIEFGAHGTRALVWEKGHSLGEIQLQLLGAHNLSNVLAAIAVARHVGIEWTKIQAALPEFVGAKRRFELLGESKGITFIDDYAHHPSEIRATLAAAKLQAKNRVVAIFQPHRFSRTQRFLLEFSQCFGDADLVVVSEIYGASETNHTQLTGAKVAQAIAQHHSDVYYQPSLAEIQQFLVEKLGPGDLAIFLGAGNLNSIIAPAIAQISANA